MAPPRHFGPSDSVCSVPASSSTLRASPKHFWRLLGLITAAGLCIRIFAVAVASRKLSGDGLVFNIQADFIARGLGFVDAARLGFAFVNRPSAAHPPLFALVLSAVSWVGYPSVLAHQLTAAVLSAAAVPLLGLTAREVAGRRAGLLAAALAALYPNLWASDASVMSESLYVTMIALSLWMLCRLWKRPTMSHAICAGLAIALAALTRAEAILLLPLVVVPLCLQLRALDIRRRITLIAGVFAAAVLVTSPWIVRNLVTFDRPVLLSENSDSVIAGSNCHDTYYGPALGSWVSCNGSNLPKGDESVEGAALRSRGFHYAHTHLSRLPVVLAARVGRAWDVYRPFQGLSDVRSGWIRFVAVLAFWVVMTLAAPGAIVLHRRGVTIAPFLAQPLLITLVAITGYGLWRLRLPLDEAAIVLASVTLAGGWRWKAPP